MSKIAIIGATGRAGTQLREEALRRGHDVTAIARKANTLAPHDHLQTKNVDIQDSDTLAHALQGHDAVFSAAHFTGVDAESVINAAKKASVPRLLVVGGAGSLFAAPGLRVIDAPGFPAEYKAEASAGASWLETLKKETVLDWTFLSPSAEFVEGSRTGSFRLGKDDLLVDANGRSWISFADYAIAYLDELEQPRHSRQRFTIGY